MDSFWVTDAYKRQHKGNKSKRGITSSELTYKALEIACGALNGHEDRTGRPLILRAIHIAEQMQGGYPVYAALLADVAQHGMSYEVITEAGFPEKVISVLGIMETDPALPYLDYIERVRASENQMAINIVISGLLYDCDLSRYAVIDDDAVKWYYNNLQAMAILERDNGRQAWRDRDMQYMYDSITSRTLNIRSEAPSIGGRLSNLTPRAFTFCGVDCGSVEGVLQSLKFPEHARQIEICKLRGSKAKNAGRHQDWKTSQTLYWQDRAYARDSPEYQELLNAMYKAAFDQCEQFREDLANSRGYTLLHSIGLNDPALTVLTIDEFVSRLERLRNMIE